jgi:two-component system sensor histidine kinase VicK
MELFLFKSADKKYLYSFRQFMTRQNFKVAQISSYLIITFCLTVIIFRLAFDFSAIPQRREYGVAIGCLLIVSVIYAITFQLINKIKNRRKQLIAKYFSSGTYPFIVIIGMMWFTFIAQHNPANTMTMFLVGMFYVGVLWLFQIWEVTVVMGISLAIFSYGLYYFNIEHVKILMNCLVAGYIMLAFYIISRVLYSYHLNYFMQLKTIENKNREIGRINKMQTDMLGIVVHDLRSPINSITTLTDLVKNYAENDVERNEYYDMILAACEEANHIIQDLIAVAKEQDKNIQLTETNINDLLESIKQNWAHRLPEDRTLLLTLCKKNVYAFIDTVKIQRVVDNLVSNAIKFTDEDGIIQIQLKENNNSRIRISILDDGVGIPESLQPFLFDRFSKAGRLGLKGEKSHGLGLSICRQILQQHGGAIGVESKEGIGSTFYIDLPLSKITDTVPDIKPAINLEAIEDLN